MIEIQVTGSQAVRANMARIGTVLTQQALAETAVKVEDYIEGEAGKHHQTGALVRSIYKAKIPEGWFIGHDLRTAKHALFFQFGTGLHGPRGQKYEIRAKNKRALHYESGGVFWFWFGPKSPQEQATIRKWVRKESGDNARVMFRWPQHPGIKKDAWLERAAALTPKIFEQQIAAKLKAL